MRLDDFLSSVFLIKRRTLAKEWIVGGKVKLNGKRVKPAHPVKPDDIIEITYPRNSLAVQVVDVPLRSIPKPQAEKYYKQIDHH